MQIVFAFPAFHGVRLPSRWKTAIAFPKSKELRKPIKKCKFHRGNIKTASWKADVFSLAGKWWDKKIMENGRCYPSIVFANIFQRSFPRQPIGRRFERLLRQFHFPHAWGQSEENKDERNERFCEMHEHEEINLESHLGRIALDLIGCFLQY